MRPTGLYLLPSRIADRLGFWSAWRQRKCPHPGHRRRVISGDERLYGYRWQCMDCGQLSKVPV
jgi:hypothetical protein